MAAGGLQDIDRYVTPQARLGLAEAIEEAGGNEVFFLGQPGEDGRIDEVRVYCRGNKNAVPALAQIGRPGDVVIHNHPSGQLLPSDPDLQLASHYGQEGVGFFIVNNKADAAYVVVEPLQDDRKPLEAAAVDAVFTGEQGLPGLLPGYEPRPGQVDMGHQVAAAQNEGGILVVEAGTGTGKSLAYLVPSVLRALQNGERVAVSTRTRHLQQQLISHDVPLLQKLFPKLQVAILKGRGNYLCRRKFEERRLEVGNDDDPDDAERRFLDDLRAWVAVTSQGDRDDLSFVPDRSLWELVESSTEHTQRAACPHFDECFFYNSRRRASQAQLLVVNHSLLLADLLLREKGVSKGLLPRYDHVVLDEAHHLEDVVTEFAGSTVTGPGLLRQLGRIRPVRGRRKGLAVRLRTALQTQEISDEATALTAALEALLAGTESCREALRVHLEDLGEAVLEELEEESTSKDGGRARSRRASTQMRLRDSFQEDRPGLHQLLHDRLGRMNGEVTRLVRSALKVQAQLDYMPEGFRRRFLQTGLDLGSVASRLQEATVALGSFLEIEEDNIRWIEVSRDRDGRARPRFSSRPVDVAPIVREVVVTGARSLVLTSATLSVAGRFDHFLQRTGLDEKDHIAPRLRLSRIPSPFDYADQVLLGLPRGLPDPGSRGHQEAVTEAATEVIRIADGRTFVLFTSYRMLQQTAAAVSARLGREYTILKQGELPRERLLDLFRTGSRVALFGTDSFWEGVDVRGEALSCVLIARLPFRVPTEPVQQARAERVEAAGGDAFSELSVPQAVLRFRQGFGRLIRHRQDRGVVLVLDPRIQTRSYGRRFLASLPEAVQPVRAPLNEILTATAEFLLQVDLDPSC